MTVDVYLDLTRLAGRRSARPPTGIDRLEFAYLNHFLAQSEWAVRYCRFERSHLVLMERAEAEALRQSIVADWVERELPLVQDDAATGPWRLAGQIKRLSRLFAGRIDATPRMTSSGRHPILLTVSHSNLARPQLWRMAKARLGAKLVVFLHDLIPYQFPEYSRDGESTRHLQRLETVYHEADLILVNSHCTAGEFRNFCALSGREPPPIEVLRLGVAPPYLTNDQPAVPDGETENWFVVIGTIEPRKNHHLLLVIWRRLVSQLGENAPKLVVIGRRGWEIENVTRMIGRCPALQGHVIEHSNLSDAQVLDVLRRSRALLFPSYAEGYGLPLAEALTAQIPVVCSDLPVFREVAADVPEFLDHIDGVSWIKAIIDYAAPGSPRRAEQIARMANFVPPTWAEHFDRLHDAVRPLINPVLPESALLAEPVQGLFLSAARGNLDESRS